MILVPELNHLGMRTLQVAYPSTLNPTLNWVAVKELKLSYQNRDIHLSPVTREICSKHRVS